MGLKKKDWHLITNADPIRKTGTCTQCGESTPIRFKDGRWKCKVKLRDFHTPVSEHLNAEPLRRKAFLEQSDIDACEICKSKEPPLCADHCHVTGEMRGVLCRTCNAGLGMFKDDPNMLMRAIQYLLER
jgi:hypothetical protein